MAEVQLLGDERKSDEHFKSCQDGSSKTSLSMDFTELVSISEELRTVFNRLGMLVTKAVSELLLSL